MKVVRIGARVWIKPQYADGKQHHYGTVTNYAIKGRWWVKLDALTAIGSHQPVSYSEDQFTVLDEQMSNNLMKVR